ncbi:hypothetical protein Y033_5339 [Burkholderia pseudomallei MSHR435]|nr:hypothetical protein DO65_4942 [Burkholderia pseudomallei]KGX79121.1 hypothetical protein Y033_5339 [Burkholderia pseudomallei MSHR435]
MRDDRVVDQREPRGRQRDERAASVRRVRAPLDPPRLLEPVDPVGHAARRDHRRVVERRRRERVRRAAAPKRREHVELARLQAVAREKRVEPVARDDERRLLQPPEHDHRRRIEIRALAAPLLDRMGCAIH